MSSIERALSHSKFRNEYQKAIAAIFFTCRSMEYFYQQHLNQYGITWQQFYVLRILKTEHPEKCNVNFLKEKMIDQNSDVSRIIERLRKMNLVTRDLKKEDRRHVEISITKKGRDLLDRIKKRDREVEAVLKQLSEKEVKQLNGLLEKIFSDGSK